jgi:hypothetical protein
LLVLKAVDSLGECTHFVHSLSCYLPNKSTGLYIIREIGAEGPRVADVAQAKAREVFFSIWFAAVCTKKKKRGSPLFL